MTNKIEQMILNGKIAVGCFMDIEGALDNTEFDVITEAARARDG